MKDLRRENDNLKEWRLKKAYLTERLLKKALDELITIKAVISQKSVCEMMEKIASKDDREYKAIISPSAISKNDIYKNILFSAKKKFSLLEDKKQNYKIDGDKQLEIFQLKTIIAKKEVELKELNSIIDRANIRTDIINRDSRLDNQHKIDENTIKKLFLEVIQLSLNNVFIYKDSSGNLIDEYSSQVIITKEIYNKLKV
ncbi:hypothetical protein [Malaciobacter marinus]|uniref:hypothetical protein n=1 Tax=Malaciobacter marinus TaxID=505249 RepID=UPI003B008BC8